MSFGMPPHYNGSIPAPKSVPVSVIILTKNEEANITRCIESVRWAEQTVVIDSGSSDSTVALAEAAGAEVVQTSWRGWGRQREWALRHRIIRNQWVYFVDADEWVSQPLAAEIRDVLAQPLHDAYSQMFRLVFMGRWIRHSGWYPSVQITRLLKRNSASYGDDLFSEHPVVDGTTGILANDVIDDDQKGLARWLNKHVEYAQLEASRRRQRKGVPPRRDGTSRLQHFVKYRAAPSVPARPLAQFLYMYVLRLGFLDGRQGLLFCLLHAWFQMCVTAIQREKSENTESDRSDLTTDYATQVSRGTAE